MVGSGGSWHGEVADGEEHGEAKVWDEANGVVVANFALFGFGKGGGGHCEGDGWVELYVLVQKIMMFFVFFIFKFHLILYLFFSFLVVYTNKSEDWCLQKPCHLHVEIEIIFVYRSVCMYRSWVLVFSDHQSLHQKQKWNHIYNWGGIIKFYMLFASMSSSMHQWLRYANPFSCFNWQCYVVEGYLTRLIACDSYTPQINKISQYYQ